MVPDGGWGGVLREDGVGWVGLMTSGYRGGKEGGDGEEACSVTLGPTSWGPQVSGLDPYPRPWYQPQVLLAAGASLDNHPRQP